MPKKGKKRLTQPKGVNTRGWPTRSVPQNVTENPIPVQLPSLSTLNVSSPQTIVVVHRDVTPEVVIQHTVQLTPTVQNSVQNIPVDSLSSKVTTDFPVQDLPEAGPSTLLGNYHNFTFERI
uniref:Uncharacterized protein n=1 Tax=Anoplophora glabripennis TaxID=217634 RepID=V5GU91_ANOGL